MFAPTMREAAAAMRDPDQMRATPWIAPVAFWLDQEADRFEAQTFEDTPECPSCDTGYCRPHGKVTVHDDGCGSDLLWDGQPIPEDASADRCDCFNHALDVARTFLTMTNASLAGDIQ